MSVLAPKGRSLLLFSRDLRVHDHPALHAAALDGEVLALFVLDERILRADSVGANRIVFLLDSLHELRSSLRARGAELIVRRGDPVAIAQGLMIQHGITRIRMSRDSTPYARMRSSRLEEVVRAIEGELLLSPGITILDPDLLRTGGGTHYQIFTPYYRTWQRARRRELLSPPGEIVALAGVDAGTIPTFDELCAGADPIGERVFPPLFKEPFSPGRAPGGESVALMLLQRFLAGGAEQYLLASNQLGEEGTSLLSAHLHFGTLSAALFEWELSALANAGAEAAIRQLCWREFYHALLSGNPRITRENFRERSTPWRRDDAELAAWRRGETGVDLVDAAMRQLLKEGFMHNRARLVVASYLTKDMGHHWSEGARHFARWLSDADVACNVGNWQWMAGTGNDTRPNRRLSPQRQAERFDADGRYRARYLSTTSAQEQLRLL